MHEKISANIMLQLRYFITLSAMLLLAACSSEESLPISKPKLQAALMDLHLAEAAMSHLTGNRKDSVATLYYEQICKIHGISRAELDSSIAILRRNPAMTEEVYGEMPEALDKLKLELAK